MGIENVHISLRDAYDIKQLERIAVALVGGGASYAAAVSSK